MKKERKNTQAILIDIQYYDSMNAFECWYGEHISYQEIEQKSYIEFKDILFEKISKDIKFRKHERIGQVLTIIAYMLPSEIQKLKKTLEEDELKMVHNWVVSNITIIKDNELILNQKNTDDLELDDTSDEFEDE